MRINRAFFTISILVIGMHAVILACLYGSKSPVSFAPSPEKVVVRTIALHPKKFRDQNFKEITEIAAVEPSLSKNEDKPLKNIDPPPETPALPKEPAKPAVKKDTPKKNTPLPKKNVEKKIEKKPVVQSSSKPQTPPETKKPPPSDKQKESMEKAKESIGKIQKNQAKISAMKPTGTYSDKKLDPVRFEAIDSASDTEAKEQGFSQEVGYSDELAGRLKLLLRLPEYGEVKIALILDRSGKVSEVKIVSSASEANKNHVKKVLPTLTFPGFGNNFGSEETHTFQITLRNDFS
jgi:colicin import membrane protein